MILVVQSALQGPPPSTMSATSPVRKVLQDKVNRSLSKASKQPLTYKNSTMDTASQVKQDPCAVHCSPSLPAPACQGTASERTGAGQTTPCTESERPSDGRGAAPVEEETPYPLQNPPRSAKADTKALRLQEQLLRQAFSRAPPALRVICFPCICCNDGSAVSCLCALCAR
jgi:hypothetical protein